MLITKNGQTAGALSAGCIEEEIGVHAREVMSRGTSKLVTFDTRRRFGCSGSIEIFIESIGNEFMSALRQEVASRATFVIETIFENSALLGSRIVPENHVQTDDAFLQRVEPTLRLLVIGSGPDSDALRAQAILLGWEAIVVETITELRSAVDDRMAAVIATHNFGRDCAALRHLMPLGLRYVGLIGPRRRRDELLIDVIDSGAALKSALFAPAGLDLGADSTSEIALSIIAEIQSVFAQVVVQRLSEGKAPIHGRAGAMECATSPR